MAGVLIVGTWDNIELDHKRVQLAWRRELLPGWGKPKYVEAVLRDLTEPEIVDLARRCIATFPDRCCIGVQDALWWVEAGGPSVLSEVTRLAVADALDGRRMHPQIEESRPSPAVYTDTVRGDRDLRLAGYEVYRFSGHELHTDDCAATMVAEFFSRLFQRHGVKT